MDFAIILLWYLTCGKIYSSNTESTFGQIDRCTVEGVALFSMTPRHADSWRPPTQILHVAARDITMHRARGGLATGHESYGDQSHRKPG